jgi:hypothetical protein
MIAEIIAIINAGVGAVEGVTRIIKSICDISDNSSRITLEQSVQNIQGRVESVESELRTQQPNQNSLLESYAELINALQQDSNYASHLKIVPTDDGTWKVMRRKNTILRDPQGEY